MIEVMNHGCLGETSRVWGGVGLQSQQFCLSLSRKALAGC